jgi:hypothetical protein
MKKKNIIDRFKPTSTFMFQNVNNSLKILAGVNYKQNAWFTYNDGKSDLQCKVNIDKSSFTWASL